MEKQLHPLPPVFDTESRILILGSFPSVLSRETGFYYGNPRNRFWKVLSRVFCAPLPQTNGEKKRFLLDHRVALWDVIASCEISGSSDSSIRNAVPNDLSIVLEHSAVRRIYANGSTAARLYNRLLLPITHLPASPLPSTSPANASYSLEQLEQRWRDLKQEIG